MMNKKIAVIIAAAGKGDPGRRPCSEAVSEDRRRTRDTQRR